MSVSARFLGFAFANADILFEVDRQGVIRFIAGSGELIGGPTERLAGTRAANLFEAAEAEKFDEMARRLENGRRTGPLHLKLAGGNDVAVAMLRLSENGENISCTLSRNSPSGAGRDSKTGLAGREGFLAALERHAGDQGAALTLVEVPGLAELCASLPPAHAEKLLAAIGDSIVTSGAQASGRITDTRFGAVAAANVVLGLGKLIGAAVAAAGLKPPRIREAALSLKSGDLSDQQRLLALRYAVEKFAENGKLPSGDIAKSFAAMMQETQDRLLAMTRTVDNRDFQLVYQAIADLRTGKVSHYEALARFDNGQGTAESVKFIEALGIADAFDLAVAAKIVSLMENDSSGRHHIAFNISGRTIASPASYGMLVSMLARHRKLAPRLLVEITETAAIGDLDSAAEAVAGLKAMGFRVGLDDFGAGAASINYLHALPVDFVKFDGAIIRKIGASPRHDALLAGLAKLCGEMGVVTIAEWVEDAAAAQAVQEMGFTLGQGHHWGVPVSSIPAPAALGRRKGVQESWG